MIGLLMAAGLTLLGLHTILLGKYSWPSQMRAPDDYRPTSKESYRGFTMIALAIGLVILVIF